MNAKKLVAISRPLFRGCYWQLACQCEVLKPVLAITILLLNVMAACSSSTPATQPAQTLIGQTPTSHPAEPLTITARMIDRPDEVVALLSNGMRVIVKQYKVSPVVAVRMYVRTGSIYEDPRLGAGLSHLFEHLLHGGATTTRTEAAEPRTAHQNRRQQQRLYHL